MPLKRLIKCCIPIHQLLKSSVAGILSTSLAPGSVQPPKLASPSEPSCLKQICRFSGFLGSISFISFSKTAKFNKSKNQVKVFKTMISSSSFQEQDFKSKNQKRPRSPTIVSQSKKRSKNPPKRGTQPIHYSHQHAYHQVSV